MIIIIIIHLAPYYRLRFFLNDTCYAGYVSVIDSALVTGPSRAQPAWRALYEPSEANAAFCAKQETNKESDTMGGEKVTLWTQVLFFPLFLSRA